MRSRPDGKWAAALRAAGPLAADADKGARIRYGGASRSEPYSDRANQSFPKRGGDHAARRSRRRSLASYHPASVPSAGDRSASVV